MSAIRTFIAISLDPMQARSVVQVQSELRRHDDNCIRWVREDHLHINLAFLGDVESSKVAEVCQMACDVARRHPSFEWQIGGLGTFPNLRRPNVLWAGVQDASGSMTSIHEDLRTALAPMGFPLEQRTFRPHVTLGRVRRGVRIPRTLSESIQSRHIWQGPSARADHFSVLASELTPDGPVYAVLASCPFGLAKS